MYGACSPLNKYSHLYPKWFTYQLHIFILDLELGGITKGRWYGIVLKYNCITK